MTTSMAPMAALPSAGGERPRGLLLLGVLLADVAGVMLLATLVGAYLHLRHAAGFFPPKGIKIDRYLGNMTVITMLMTSVTVEWANTAIRRDQRRQASAAFGVTIGLALAVLNLLSWGAGRAGFHPGASSYATVTAALVLLLGIVIGIGVGFITLTLFRVAGSQVSAFEPEQARAAAWYWHFAVAATVTVWYTVVILR